MQKKIGVGLFIIIVALSGCLSGTVDGDVSKTIDMNKYTTPDGEYSTKIELSNNDIVDEEKIVEMRIDNELVDEKTIKLDALESKTVILTGEIPNDEFSVSVNDYTKNVSVTEKAVKKNHKHANEKEINSHVTIDGMITISDEEIQVDGGYEYNGEYDYTNEVGETVQNFELNTDDLQVSSEIITDSYENGEIKTTRETSIGEHKTEQDGKLGDIEYINEIPLLESINFSELNNNQYETVVSDGEIITEAINIEQLLQLEIIEDVGVDVTEEDIEKMADEMNEIPVTIVVNDKLDTISEIHVNIDTEEDEIGDELTDLFDGDIEATINFHTNS